MPDHPDARALLDAAREALLTLLGDTEERHHYTLRMVASAMAIARREIDAPAHGGSDALLWQRVCTCDTDDVAAQKTLHAALVAGTRARLAVSNPKFLAGR